jgi:hypothetical protein
MEEEVGDLEDLIPINHLKYIDIVGCFSLVTYSGHKKFFIQSNNSNMGYGISFIVHSDFEMTTKWSCKNIIIHLLVKIAQ